VEWSERSEGFVVNTIVILGEGGFCAKPE